MGELDRLDGPVLHFQSFLLGVVLDLRGYGEFSLALILTVEVELGEREWIVHRAHVARRFEKSDPAIGQDVDVPSGRLGTLPGEMEIPPEVPRYDDSPAGRQAYIQGSTLAVWEVLFLVQSYKADVSAVARHLKWPEAKVQAAVNYAKAFPEEIEGALSENAATDFETLKRMLPQATELVSRGAGKG